MVQLGKSTDLVVDCLSRLILFEILFIVSLQGDRRFGFPVSGPSDYSESTLAYLQADRELF